MRKATALRHLRNLLIAAAASATLATGAHAQSGALQGMSQNRGQPINITADSLELRDKEKKAIFTGKVKAIQGDSTIECGKLTVYYDGEPAAAGAAPRPAGAGGMPSSNQIRRLEAEGGVVVTQKDQVATGDRGVYDMKSNTVELTGKKVTATQGKNTIEGEKLFVDLTSGLSRVESSQGSPGRVSGTFLPSEAKQGADKPQNGARAPAPPPGTQPRSSTNGNNGVTNSTGTTPRPNNPNRPTRDARQTPSQPLPLSR
jgi:lipopolysaccharide export system protein LptA